MARTARSAAALLAFALAGCGGIPAGPPAPFRDLASSLADLEEVYSAKRIRDCLRLPPRGQTAEAHRECRDEITQALMMAVDVRYAVFEQEMLNAQRSVGMLGSILQLGLSAGASVAGGGTAQALAAASTGVGGAQEVFSREMLLNRTVTALQASMQARRNELGLTIRTGLDQTADRYPLGEALSDLLAYYRAGTLIGAAVTLNEAAAERARDARNALDARVGLAPRSPPQRPADRMQQGGVSKASAPPPWPLEPPTNPSRPSPNVPPTLSEADRLATSCLRKAYLSPATQARLLDALRSIGKVDARSVSDFINYQASSVAVLEERRRLARAFCGANSDELRATPEGGP